jgi:GST-like protein
MIILYTWKTPNGRKPAIMLEELGWAYDARPIDIAKDEQFGAEFLKVAPNNKIPAIIDPDAEGGPLSIFESGAILTYLAEKSGRFWPLSGPARWAVQEWLHWQIGGLGPMLGQLGYFARRAPEKVPLAINRFAEEVDRLFGVMERRLGDVEYLGGDYSIADMASYPWMAAVKAMMPDVLASQFDAKPNIDRWMVAVAARPAVARGMSVLA